MRFSGLAIKKVLLTGAIEKINIVGKIDMKKLFLNIFFEILYVYKKLKVYKKKFEILIIK
tara:strand:- start:314 stop:493 length:180 start_codon:yes stop_codon:yes gene_type:complete